MHFADHLRHQRPTRTDCTLEINFSIYILLFFNYAFCDCILDIVSVALAFIATQLLVGKARRERLLPIANVYCIDWRLLISVATCNSLQR